MAQKSHFKMQTQGIEHDRGAFPQWPGRHVHNPTFIQTAHGYDARPISIKALMYRLYAAIASLRPVGGPMPGNQWVLSFHS